MPPATPEKFSRLIYVSFNLWERKKALSKVYRRRQPEKNDLYRLVYHNLEALEQTWPETYQDKYGCYRDTAKDGFTRYLDCGLLAHGCAKAQCENPECNHSELIAFSCKRRGHLKTELTIIEISNEIRGLGGYFR